jgi:DNA helicase-2/ATP-dependent DNA helicase PcrA
MDVTKVEREVENKKLAMVVDQIERQLSEAQQTSLDKKEEVKSARKWMWEDLTRDVSKFENTLDLVQHGLDLYRQERIYLFSSSLVYKLEKMQSSPYFGRIDFLEEGTEQKEEVYIGISSLTDQRTGGMLVYDWRAPISSLFYDYQLGQAEYVCPEGPIEGNILLKRQYKISSGNMKYMFDNSLQIGDDMLQEMLSKHTDDKMKSIVTTIQREQNQVIRDGQHKVLIVQGSAGSGKTSIALQRVAYLLYKNRETMNSDHIVIFSPNQLFNDYIADVLPELGEENMLQTTFQEFTDKVIPEALKAEDKYSQMEYILACQDQAEYGTRMKSIRYKASNDFLQVIKNYIHYLETDGMIFKDVTYEEEVIISKGELSVLFYKEFKNVPLRYRFEKLLVRVHAAIKSYKKNQVKKVREKLLKHPKYIGTDKEIAKLSRAIVKKRLHPLMEEMKVWASSYAYQYYCWLFQQQDVFLSVSSETNIPQDWNEIRRQSKVFLEQDELLYEDVAPFIYLKMAFEGIPTQSTIRHCIIDEAQDYSIFHYEMMKQLFPRSSFTVLGDLNQSLHNNSNQNHYRMVMQSLETDNASIVRLYKSYRSTQEIVNFSKAILVDGETVESINRSGIKPQVIQVPESLLPDVIARDIRKLEEQGMGSIAIICKTAKESLRVYDHLKQDLNLRLITKKDKTFNKGIVVIPAYLAKGLEFDAVLIYNGGEETYHCENERKLLYTACTRALHQLHIYYCGSISPFITFLDASLYDLIHNRRSIDE